MEFQRDIPSTFLCCHQRKKSEGAKSGEWGEEVVHSNNATAEKCRTFCEEHRLWLAPHPPYSPDLAPSDFFLFGHIKECLKGMVFPSYDELLDAIGEVVTGIDSETLTALAEHWMEGLE
jgi:hypothetical protein